MSRPFGWQFPPGVTPEMIDEQFGPRRCDECGEELDERFGLCPTCDRKTIEENESDE